VNVACAACRAEVSLAVSGPTLLRRALPRGWRPRRLDGRVFILCDICGNLRQFVGGLSPYLQDRLGLASNVSIELPEYTELPDTWIAHQRRRRGPICAARSGEETMVDITKIIATGRTDADPEREARAEQVAAWTSERAGAAAAAEGVVLTTAHREVISVLQSAYIANGAARRARDLAKMLDESFASAGGRKYLFELFPGGPVAQGCRLAGIPAPADATDASFGSVL
jgi:tRNA 2-thiouridine synthesizing protein E